MDNGHNIDFSQLFMRFCLGFFMNIFWKIFQGNFFRRFRPFPIDWCIKTFTIELHFIYFFDQICNMNCREMWFTSRKIFSSFSLSFSVCICSVLCKRCHACNCLLLNVSALKNDLDILINVPSTLGRMAEPINEIIANYFHL